MTSISRFLSAGALLALFVSPGAWAALRYSLAYEAATESMRVELCGAQAAAQRDFVLDRGAARFLSELERSSGKPLEAGRDGWSAADWQAGECLHYRAALGRVADRNAEDVGWRLKVRGMEKDSDLIVSAQQWLLETEHVGDAEVRVDLPSGYALSAPWRLDRQTPAHFRIPATPRDWATNIAIGRFAVRELPAGASTVHLALAGVRDAATQDKLTKWVSDVVHAALSAYGRLPLDDVQVLTLPVVSPGSAVVFGQSSRGQGHGLILLIDPSHPLTEFEDDWTAVHEFAHLFHPYLGDEGRWLAEGLATYWQNVLRARAAMLTAPQTWGRLEAGFVRGREASHSGLPLGGRAGQAHERGFTRIYWAGAAYWLRVDTELRASGAGALSVDLALRKFRDCCLQTAREWSPDDFVAKLDALLGTEVFAARYREAAAQTSFPDLSGTYAKLGISKDAAGALHFDDSAPAAGTRKAIMAAKSP